MASGVGGGAFFDVFFLGRVIHGFRNILWSGFSMLDTAKALWQPLPHLLTSKP